jgi:hypothetical protein
LYILPIERKETFNVGAFKMRCKINLPDYDKTQSGKQKVWQTDGIVTFCCCSVAAFFVWEKSTKYNGYNGYSTYIACQYVEML